MTTGIVAGVISQARAIADELAQRIADGDLPPGSPLPSVASLAEEKGTAPANVQSAYDLLKASGVATAMAGRGTYVRIPKPRMTRDASQLYKWSQAVAALNVNDEPADDTGTNPWISNSGSEAHHSTISATPELAAELGILAGSEVFRRIVRTATVVDEDPIFVNTSYIPVEIFGDRTDLMEDTAPVPGGQFTLLAKVGIEIHVVVDRVRARPPTLLESDSMALDEGVSVFEIRKTMRDPDGRVVEISDVVLPGDSTELLYTTELAEA